MKTLKKVLSMAMALTLVVTGLVLAPVDAKADEYTAKLSYASGDWSASVWGDTETTQTTVNGEGTYSFSYETSAAASGAAVFVVDIEGAGEAYKGWSVKDVKITLDGTDLAIDESKIVVGDTEEKGNFRISFFNTCNGNEVGDTAAAPFAYDSLAFSSKLEVSFTLTSEAGLNTTFGAAGGDDTPVAAEHTAALSYASGDWSASMWGEAEGASTTVTGAGTYSVSWTLPEGTTGSSASVFVVDIKGAGADLLAAGKEYNVTDVKVIADDVDIPVDITKVIDGDIEENGNYRIEIYNNCNPDQVTMTNPPLDIAALNFTKKLVVEFTIEMIAAEVEGGGEETPAVTFDPAGEYNGYLGFQTPSYTFRNEWWEASYGRDTDYFNQVTGWVDNVATKMDGTFTDVAIKGNGTYKVTLEGIGEWMKTDLEASETGAFNLLFVSTDIPYTEDITVSDVKFYVDGKVVHTDAEGVIDETADYIMILVQKTYEDVKPEISYFNAPTKSMEIEFTISGFNYDNATGGEGEGSTETTPDTEATPDTQTGEKDDQQGNDGGNILPIIIAVVVVAVVAVVVVVVLKKKKA